MKNIRLIFILILAFTITACTQRNIESTHPNGLPMKVVYTKKKKDKEDLVKIEYFFENGMLESTCEYKDNKKHGKAITKYSNGKTESKENYYNGLLHGQCEYYYENGDASYTAEFYMGVSHGKWIIFNEDSKPMYEQIFDNGNLIESKIY
ncbi:MAG: hypothetical protein GX879_04040 [Bacteroidales bacterium]|nr:hypothetical protein [Bacteroidales bacterium]